MKLPYYGMLDGTSAGIETLDNIQLSERVQRVRPSPTLAVTTRAAELRAAGQDIIGLGAGGSILFGTEVFSGDPGAMTAGAVDLDLIDNIVLGLLGHVVMR